MKIKTVGFGIFFSAISRYCGIIISIILGAILARLLSPEEFGIVALVTVFVNFFVLLSDFGLGPAVVQNQTISDGDLSSIFTFSILLAIILSILFFCSADLIVSFYDNSDLYLVIRYLSASVFFNSMSIVPRSILQKSLQFKKLGIITIIVQFICGSIAVYLAFNGFSYYSIVIQSILLGAFSFFSFYIINPINVVRKIEISSLRKIIRFSTFQFSFNFINYFSRNLDNILIGKYLSPSLLGFYDKSYQLMMMPVSNLTHVITPVIMPVLATFQNDKKRVFNSYLNVVKILAFLGFPLSIFLYFSASDIISLLYGNQWVESIPIFRILSLTVGIQMVLSSSGSIFQAVNRTDLLFYSGILSAIFMISGISYGVFIGESLESVGYGLIFAFLINFFQGFYFLIRIALNSSLLIFFKSFWFAGITSFVIFLILLIFDRIDFGRMGLIYNFIIFLSICSIMFFLKTEYRNLFYKFLLGK